MGDAAECLSQIFEHMRNAEAARKHHKNICKLLARVEDEWATGQLKSEGDYSYIVKGYDECLKTTECVIDMYDGCVAILARSLGVHVHTGIWRSE